MENVNPLINWSLTNLLKPGGLATILVAVFLAMYTGLLPSPIMASIDDVSREHKDIVYLLTQICLNGAKDNSAISKCFVVPLRPGILKEIPH